MRNILDKIYYSFYKVEKKLFPYGKKGGYSGAIMINMITNIEIGISLLLAGLTSLLFKNYGIERLIVLMLSAISFYFVLAYLEKRIWKEPSEEELRKLSKDGINVIGWSVLGLFMSISSFLFSISINFEFNLIKKLPDFLILLTHPFF